MRGSRLGGSRADWLDASSLSALPLRTHTPHTHNTTPTRPQSDATKELFGKDGKPTKVAPQREYNQLMGAQDAILQDIVRHAHGDTISTAFLRAGPRSQLHFDPSKVRGGC